MHTIMYSKFTLHRKDDEQINRGATTHHVVEAPNYADMINTVDIEYDTYKGFWFGNNGEQSWSPLQGYFYSVDDHTK